MPPYKVVRIDIDKDLTGWRPEQGKTDKHGQLIEDRIYNQRDFDKTLVIDERTQLVARKVSEFLKTTDRFAKTIVFCEDIDHAERMRQALVNENADLVAQHEKYVMRITGDNPEGKAELDNFILPEKRIPAVVTTSKLLTTGVDVQTCKLIVLDQRIQSMTEFKQTIGRGTRINEDYDKLWFTIMDFKKATELFADEKFDGLPVVIYEPKGDDAPVPPDDAETTEHGESGDLDGDLPNVREESPDITIDADTGARRIKYVVNDVPVWVVAERVQYYGKDGKLITESLKEHTRKTVREEFASFDDFLARWTQADQKQAIIKELEKHGVLLDALAEEVGKELDPFDLVCHVAFDRPPLTRKERAENVRKRDCFTRFGDQARAVLDALLEKYADVGVAVLEDRKVLRNDPLTQFGTPVEIVELFGGKAQFDTALRELEAELYKAA